jgi:hypothetical protein
MPNGNENGTSTWRKAARRLRAQAASERKRHSIATWYINDSTHLWDASRKGGRNLEFIIKYNEK